MLAKIIFSVCAVLSLAACVSFQDKPINSQISYPLAGCDKKQLDAAVEAQRAESRELQYSNKWVCVTPPLADSAKQVPIFDKPRLELQALNNPTEVLLRETLEDPLVINKKGQSRPVLGVALSGGGTKAATVAMGVLQGLSDNQLLDTAAYVSTVSGGGTLPTSTSVTKYLPSHVNREICLPLRLQTCLQIACGNLTLLMTRCMPT